MPHGHAELGESTPQSVFYAQGRFGRLFPTLPPFAADPGWSGMRWPSSAPRVVLWMPPTTCRIRSP